MKIFPLVIAMMIQHCLLAQQSSPVTESNPVENEGLKAGYNISEASTKEVGDKGNFSRFKIQFWVTNTSSQAKLILRRPGGIVFGSGTSDELVRFNCRNATGARLTNKDAVLKAKPCILDALVDDVDASGKTIQRSRRANIGFWIRPGESIAISAIMIVPLNEHPDMTVSFYPNSSSMGASVINDYGNYNNNNYGNNNNYNNNNNNYNNNNNTPPTFSQGYVRIKNPDGNFYINNQTGPASCTNINLDWWSAQWEMVPVNGTNYFLIKNRWKNNYISSDNSNLISDNSQSPNSMWSLEQIGNSHVYTIKNAANNSSLIFDNGLLKVANVFGSQPNAQWKIE